MIKFKVIEAEGFGSFVKPHSFDLDRGSTVITIKGVVGVGKTTLPSILSWGLYGKHLKEKASIESWEEIRPDNWRGTKVVINFEKDGIQYKIIRCKSFKGKIRIDENSKVNGGSNIFLFINGEYFTSKKGKTHIQVKIEEILGYSFRLFKSTIIYGQNQKRIIEESGPDKKKIFDEAFENGFIDEARKNEEVDLSKLKRLKDDIESDIDNQTTTITEYQELFEEAKEYEKNFEKNKKKEIKEYQELIAENKKDIKYYDKTFKKDKSDKGITAVIKALRSKKQKLETTKETIDQLEEWLETSKDVIIKQQKILDKKPKLCPTCNLPLSQEGYNNMRVTAKEIISKHEASIKGWKKELNNTPKIDQSEILKLEKEINNNTKRLTEIETLKKQNKVNQETMSRLIKRNKQYKIKLNEISNQTLKIKSDKYIKKIKKAKKQREESQTILKKTQEEITIKEWLIKDPLSNNGLKAYIFDNLLESVNDKLEEYSKVLGFQVEFGIDLESRRKDFYQLIKFNDGLIVNYDDLSGGQKQLVNYAVAFATYDVITEIRPCNIMFMDEPFESLNKADIELITELINNKAKQRSIYIITHNESFSPMKADKLVFSLDEDRNTIIE